MSLVTRCPTCATAFRVLPDQLSAHAGQVRCGRCGAVFDGIAGLVAERGQALRSEPSPQLALFDPSRRPQPQPPPSAASDPEPLPPFLAEQTRRPRRALWLTLALLAALVLMAQVVYHFRTELAATAPQARTPLDELCRLLGCEVPLPRDLRLLSIDSYEVRADPRRDGVIVLHAVIRNRAPFPQAYPALQFALTDEASESVASRVLSPLDYLDAQAAAQLMDKGIDANGAASFTVYLDASRARATGYRLELFYPS